MKMQVMRFPPLIIIMMVSTSCATLKAYPDRATDAGAEIQALDKYLQPDAITKYESANDSDRSGLSKQAWRNEVVNARVRADDLYFNQFQQRLFQEGIGFGLATDWIVLALNAAGTLATAGTVNALSAASTGVVGGKAAFDRSVYLEKTMPALVATMAAKRKEVLVRIREGLTKNIDEYPLPLALSDLESYYDAGTIPGAIIEVANAAGATAKNADAQLESLLIVAPVPPDLQVRRENMADFVKILKPNELDVLAKSLRVRTGDAALEDVLSKISEAQTQRAFDLLAQKIKILYGKEF
ncbi:MAG: hypothetical protein HY268_20620 [Deltaproteobacteria bacterium]|nr:hypothetical protein [Deltaproteobacteria bacterium]